MSWNVWIRPHEVLWSIWESNQILWSLPLPHVTWQSWAWPYTMTPSIDQNLHQFANLLPDWTLLPILNLSRDFGGFHRTLQRARLVNRGRLLPRTPGPVPFVTCICLMLRPFFLNLSCLRTFWVSNIPQYFFFASHLVWVLLALSDVYDIFYTFIKTDEFAKIFRMIHLIPEIGVKDLLNEKVHGCCQVSPIMEQERIDEPCFTFNQNLNIILYQYLTPHFVCKIFHGYNFQLIFPMLYMLFPRVSEINYSNRTSFFQIRCIKLTHCINDDIKNVSHEKVSWFENFKIIFKDLRCWIDVFYFKTFAS